MAREQGQLPGGHSSHESGFDTAENQERQRKIEQAAGHEAVADTVERPEITQAKRNLGGKAVEKFMEQDGTVVLHENATGELVSPEDSLGGAVVPYEQPELPVQQTPEDEPAGTPEKPLVMGEIGQDHDVERKARELADRLIEEKVENNAKRKFYSPRKAFRRMWGYEKRRQKYIEEFRAEIKESGGLHGADDRWSDEQQAEFEDTEKARLIHGGEDLLDKAGGEKRQYFDDSHEAVALAKDLLTEFASSDMSDEDFLEKIESVRTAMGEGEITQNEMFMSNYLEVAHAARGRIAQDESMEDVLDGFKLVRAEARSDTRAEIHKTKLDALYDKYEQSTFGRIVPASALALGVGVGMFVAERGSRSAVGRIFSLGGTAALAGSIAAAKAHAENNRLRSNMLLNQGRGMEYSSEVDRNNKKREKISAYEYKQVQSDTIIAGLHDINTRFDEEEMSDNLANGAIDKLADLQAIKDVSATERVELINIGVTDDPAKRVKDRLAMGQEAATLKAQIAEAMRSGDTHVLGALGLDSSTNIEELVPMVDGETPEERQANIDSKVYELINHAISLKSEALADAYRGEVDAADKAWSKYNALDSAKEGVKVAGMALVAGVVVQEAVAWFRADRAGLLERPFGASRNNPDAQNTLLNHFGGRQYNTEHISRELSPSEIRDIEARGGIVTSNHQPGVKTPSSQSINQFVQGHKGEMKSFESVNLYTNDTAPTPDLNELGGMLGKGPDGTVKVFAEMTKDGSFEGAKSIDMTNSPNVFTMAFKQPDGTHMHKVFNFGQDIPKPWADMLTQDSNGNWNFKGDGYIAWGQTNNGALEVAASMAGTGEGLTIDTSTISEGTFSYDVSYPASGPTEMPPATWFRGSKGVGVAGHPPRSERPPRTESDPSPQPQLPPAPVRAPSIERPPQQPELERARSQEVEIRSDNPTEQQEQRVEVESSERRVAREAGWPLLDLRIGVGNASAEQWRSAASIVENARAQNPDVTDEVEQLRLAMELATSIGADPDTQGLLTTLYAMNEDKQATQTEAESQTPQAPPESEANDDSVQDTATDQQTQTPPPVASTEPQVAERYNDSTEVRGRIEALNSRLDGISRIMNSEMTSAGIDAGTFERVRQVYADVIRKQGAEISNKALARRAASEVHPDRVGEDNDIVRAVNWFNDQLRRDE